MHYYCNAESAWDEADARASQPPEDAFMIPGMGYQPVPPAKYMPANDNGLTRPGDPNGCADDLVTTTFGPVELYTGDKRAPFSAYFDRPGDFMQTYTGRKLWPMDPKADEIVVEDIAHSLAMQCRYAGHCIKFYSVAEHSVLMARWVLKETGNFEWALWALMHDASEAYLVDIPRPVKGSLTNYKAIESKVMAAVCERFKLPLRMPEIVHEADDRIIADELDNMVKMKWHGKHDDPLGVRLRYWSPAEAEEEFLATFAALCGAMREMA